MSYRLFLGLLLALPAVGDAADYTVCANNCDAVTPNALFASVDLQPGDRVLVEAGTYVATIVPEQDSGALGLPVRIVGVGGRPVLSGGGQSRALWFRRSNHVVLENFDITGGNSACVFVEAHEVTMRATRVHACPSHGILMADQYSGSFTLEYSEIANTGSGQTRHALYMQSDELRYPGSVVRIRHNYIHSGNGGNLLKVRHERAEILYNWFEAATYHEIELIGPDIPEQPPGWNEDLAREDADIVGNVIVHTSTWRTAVRMGGDLNGRSKGRVRLVNNTILFASGTTGARAVAVQLGAESLEMHNNVVHQQGSNRPAIVAELVADDTPPWGSREPWIGQRQIAGSRNWVPQGATAIPQEWMGTRTGFDPDFDDLAAYDLRPSSDSALLDSGNGSPAPAPGFALPRALLLPSFEARRGRVDVGATRTSDGNIDIGAFERGESARIHSDGFE